MKLSKKIDKYVDTDPPFATDSFTVTSEQIEIIRGNSFLDGYRRAIKDVLKLMNTSEDGDWDFLKFQIKDLRKLK